MQSFQHKNFTILHHQNSSMIANARIIVNAGKCNDAPDAFGAAHYLEHMMFKGTQNYDYKELNRRLALLGSVNAYTGDQLTVYHLTFLGAKIDEALQLLTDMVFRSSFPEDEFEKERGVILEERKTTLDDAHHLFHYGLQKHQLGDQHGHPTIGTEESINGMTLKHLRDFHANNYRPNNMAIAVTGNITKEQLIGILDKYLPDLEIKANPESVPNLNFSHYHLKSDKFKQAILCLNMPTKITLKDELKMNFLPDLFNSALGGGMHSLLFDRIREELGLCYHIQSGHNAHRTYGTQQILCYLTDTNIDLVIDESKKIIEDIKANGFKPELIEIAKTQLLFALGRRLETSTGLNGMVDSYFDLEGFPIEQYVSETVRQEQVSKITNADMKGYANLVYSSFDNWQIAKMTFEESSKD